MIVAGITTPIVNVLADVIDFLGPHGAIGLPWAWAIVAMTVVVRMLLVPATMELLGDRNWWMPVWLDRIIPKLNIDCPAHDPAPAVDEPTPAPEPELVDA